jgi:hypothetical protein
MDIVKIMKRIAIVVLVAWLFIRSDGLDSLFSLFFGGTIPGTSVVIPASLMLVVYISVGLLLAHHFIFLSFNQKQKKPAKTRKRSTNRYSKVKA